MIDYISPALTHFRLVCEYIQSVGEIDPRITEIARIADNNLQFQVTTTSLNIRAGPGANYSIMGTYKKGTIVDILETNQGWGRVTNVRWICIKPAYGVLSIKK